MGSLEPLLLQHGLASHQAVLAARGYHRAEDLVQLDEDQVDDLLIALVESGADRRSTRMFLNSFHDRTAHTGGSRAAQPNPEFIHFYGLAEKINRTDDSGLEASTILKVDIDPLDELADRMHVPPGNLCRLTKTSSRHPMPVVSLLGPTGVGKSFIASTFMQSNDGVLPLVASPDQHVPTSAHVCVHRGKVHSGSAKSKPIVLFDFEGEDGRLPKNLVEAGLRRINILRMAGLTEDALQQQMEASTARRQEVIKERLPPLAYLLSDVVVFIDQVEPRRVERSDRIRRFAIQAHQAVNSLAWRPGLILVQNKWAPDSDTSPFDVSHELEWIRADLAQTFSSVSVLRIAHSNDRHRFEASINEFHNVLSRMVDEVSRFRQTQGVLFSERAFWFNFNAMVTQFGKPGQLCSSLEDVVSSNLASSCAADNALRLFESLTSAQSIGPQKFKQIVKRILVWYAYSQAGEVRRDGLHVEDAKNRFRKTYSTVVEVLRRKEPCSAKLIHAGQTYPCTQLHTGHQNTHKNPALIPVPSQNLLKRVLSFGFWKDRQPCVWRGAFEPAVQPSYEELEAVFLGFVTQDVMAYLKSSHFLEVLGEFDPNKQESELDICWLCLRADSEQVRLQHYYCRHPLCRACLMTRMMLLGRESKTLICPFCHLSSEEQPQSFTDEKKGFRILSLDGGGVRGLIEVLVLKRLEEAFAPLPITSLFDLIIGTSAGGIISMALLNRVQLFRLEILLETMADTIFSVPVQRKLYRWVTNSSACNSELFKEVLRGLFGNEKCEAFAGPPYVFCVSYDAAAKERAVMGNYPRTFLSKTLTNIGGPLLNAAMCTSAAPTIFDAVVRKFVRTENLPDGTTTREDVVRYYVDGGVVANCPAAVGVKVATELQSQSKGFDDIVVESIASIGTGLPEPSLGVTRMNALSWAGELIDIATSSEQQWNLQIEEVPAFQSKPRVRVNPPELGSLDAFGSESIPKLREGMDEYFVSDLGKQQMGKLIHLTYAKLWEVKQTQSLVVGGPAVEFSIVMQDHRCDFHSMEIAKLKDIICQRCEGLQENHLEGTDKEELCRMAKDAFASKPFLFHFEGKFAYRFANVDHELDDGQMKFNLRHHKAGIPELDVFWRSLHGDISLSGLPRAVRVSEAP